MVGIRAGISGLPVGAEGRVNVSIVDPPPALPAGAGQRAHGSLSCQTSVCECVYDLM